MFIFMPYHSISKMVWPYLTFRNSGISQNPIKAVTPNANNAVIRMINVLIIRPYPPPHRSMLSLTSGTSLSPRAACKSLLSGFPVPFRGCPSPKGYLLLYLRNHVVGQRLFFWKPGCIRHTCIFASSIISCAISP